MFPTSTTGGSSIFSLRLIYIIYIMNIEISMYVISDDFSMLIISSYTNETSDSSYTTLIIFKLTEFDGSYISDGVVGSKSVYPSGR